MTIIYSAQATNTKDYPSTRLLDGGFVCEFKEVDTMMASTLTGFGTGTIWRAAGFTYQEAPPSATNHHLTNAAGVKLYVLPVNGLYTGFPEYALEAFNAAIDGVTDDRAKIITAINAIQAAGGGALVWSGMAYISNTIWIGGWTRDIAFVGRGNLAGLKTDVDDIAIFNGSLGVPINLTFRNLTLRGAWEDNNRQSSQDNWLIQIPSAGNVLITDCRIGSSQKGGVKCGGAQTFRMTGTTIFECARGGINVSGTNKTRIEGNIFEHLGDDAISLHTRKSASDVSREHIVQGNHFMDCQGVNALGVRNLLVANNTGERMRTHFVRSGADTSFDEGYSTVLGLTIIGNVINDCLNSAAILGSGDNCYWVHVNQAKPHDGGVLDGNPGEPDGAGGIVPLVGNVRDVGPTAIRAGAWGITIANNQFLRTREAVSNYSDWNEGLMFHSTGYQDPPVNSGQLMPRIRFLSGTRYLSWNNNTVLGLRSFRFHFEDDDDAGFRNCEIRDSRFIWASSNSIFDVSGASGNRILDVQFSGLTIDGDRFYTCAGRNSDGSWTSIDDMTAFNLPNCNGHSLRDCHIWNVSQIESVTGTKRWFSGANYQYGQLASSSFSTLNKGIGKPGRGRQGWRLVDWQADTNSPNWGQVAFQPEDSFTQPLEGYWLEGMFVKNLGTDSGVPDANGMLLRGWQRLTTGNAHVTGVDWQTIYSNATSA